MEKKDVFEQVEKNMDHLVECGVWWSGCATAEQMAQAKSGELSLSLGIPFPVPVEWLEDVAEKEVLCLAGAGGLQAPLLAAAGAKVTVLDLSGKMLEKDALMAEKYDLDIRIEHGSMTDLSRFKDNTFDLIVNPASLFYVPDVMPVFKECYRVLKHGGSLILAAPNPIAYVCDYVEDGGYYKAVNRMPYCSAEHPEQGDWIEYGHTMNDYIGKQLACGFVITGYLEEQQEDITDLPFLTKAVKM